MKRPNPTRWMASALAGLALALAGCGANPATAPLDPLAEGPEETAPEILSVSGTTATFVRAPDMEVVEDGSTLLTSVTSSTLLDGALGGQLSCGRFTVTILPGTFDGVGTVTMTMRDPNVAVVDLEVSPSTLNVFKVPVDLTFDTSGLDLTDPVTIYFYDSEKRAWVDLTATADKSGEPTVHLEHFSSYGAGKAGW